MLMTLSIAGGIVSSIALLMTILSQTWWLVALNAICIVADVVFARKAYKQAKCYEDTIRHTLTDLFMREAIRDFKDFLESRKVEPENTPEDEVETDK